VVQEDLDVSETHNAELALLAGASPTDREFFIDNLLVRIHFIIVMIRWTGLAPVHLPLMFRRRTTPSSLFLRVRLINPAVPRRARM